MPDSIQAIFIFVFTLPGILGLATFNRLHDRPLEDSIEKIGFIIIVSIISTSIYSIFSDISSWLGSDVSKIQIKQVADFTYYLLVPLSVISISIGLLFAYISNRGFVQKFFNSKGVTMRTSHSSVIAAVIKEHRHSFLRFRMKDGSYIIGYPRNFSLDGDEKSIFLDKARRRPPPVDDKRQPEKDIPGEGVLLLDFEEVTYVQLLEGVE